MITIVDYGLGNLGSIANMIRKVGGVSEISNDPNILMAAKKILLPGVGSFDTGMNHLRESGLIGVLNEKALVQKIPILGICLGAQLMTRSSEEGTLPGLGWFEAETVKFDFSNTIENKLPLPNIGWRDVHEAKESVLLSGYVELPRFYFVHSYYLKPDINTMVSMTSNYGIEYASGLSKGNLHCVQFHPEKSHKFGMQMFRNFLAME